MRIYEWLVKQAFEGKSLLLKRGDMTEGPIDLVLLTNVDTDQPPEPEAVLTQHPTP